MKCILFDKIKISNGNGLSGVQFGLKSYEWVWLPTRTGRNEVFSPINHKNYNFREKKKRQVMKERKNLHEKTDKGGVNCWWLKPSLWLVDLNYNFEYDWLI